jgi:hypothetical protein
MTDRSIDDDEIGAASARTLIAITLGHGVNDFPFQAME